MLLTRKKVSLSPPPATARILLWARWFLLLRIGAGLPGMEGRAQAPDRPLYVAANARFQPLVDYLNEQIPDRKFILKEIAIADLVAAARRQEVDFVLAPPTHFVTLDATIGATALATLRDLVRPGVYSNLIGGAVLCLSEDGSIRRIADLRQKRIAAIDPLALGGWISVGRELHEEGIFPEADARVLFLKSPQAVVEALLQKRVDAGVVATGAFEELADSGGLAAGAVRVLSPRENYPESVGFPFLHSTRLYPQTAFAALPHVSEPLGRRVAIALLRMPEAGETARNSRSAGWSLPIGYQSVHRAMQELRVGPYRDFGRITLLGLVRLHWEWLLVALAALVGLLTFITLRIARLNGRLSVSQAALQQQFEMVRIAHQKQMESEARFRSVFDSSAVGILLFSMQGRILESNSAFQAMVGYSAEELTALHEEELIHPEDRGPEQTMVRELLGGRIRSYDRDKRLLCRSGEAVWIHFTGSIIRLADKDQILRVGIAADITLRKQAEEERERLIADLQKALQEVHALSGLLPICAGCKKIRDDHGYWKQVEIYIQERAPVQFSHGICPSCMKELYPEFSGRIKAG